jgi:hypothetical protein
VRGLYSGECGSQREEDEMGRQEGQPKMVAVFDMREGESSATETSLSNYSSQGVGR